MLEPEKSTSNYLDAFIDQYFSTRNIIIAGSILLLFIFVMTLILASSKPAVKNSPKVVLLEQRVDALYSQQQALQASLIDLINSMRDLKKNLNINTAENSDYDNSLPDSIPGTIPEPEVFMSDSFQSKTLQQPYIKRLSRPATDVELKRSNIAIIESKFESETENKAWRDDTETRIMRILDRKRFKKTRFDQLQCKRTICKLEITHNKKLHADKFLKEFPIALHDFDEIITVEPEQGGNFITTLFLQQRL